MSKQSAKEFIDSCDLDALLDHRKFWLNRAESFWDIGGMDFTAKVPLTDVTINICFSDCDYITPEYIRGLKPVMLDKYTPTLLSINTDDLEHYITALKGHREFAGHRWTRWGIDCKVEEMNALLEVVNAAKGINLLQRLHLHYTVYRLWHNYWYDQRDEKGHSRACKHVAMQLVSE